MGGGRSLLTQSAPIWAQDLCFESVHPIYKLLELTKRLALQTLSCKISMTGNSSIS